MSSPVEQIKERLSIVDLVSSYIKLERSGSNLKARCPFHNEKTPSFFVSPERGSFYCFGCSRHGDIFNFVQEFEGLDFRGALKMLSERAQVPLRNFNSGASGDKEKLYLIMEEAVSFYERILEANPSPLQYLKKRGLSESTIKEFRIGFIPLEWRKIYYALKKKGFDDKVIETAGLIKKARQATSQESVGGGYYDRFRGRIMFPIFDSSGRAIAFSGRIFKEDGQTPKYLNSPDTPIFNKADVLYGLHKAKTEIRRQDFSILVEGQMDLLISHQEGFKNTVALSGTALTDNLTKDQKGGGKIKLNNFGQIVNLSRNMIIAFDCDEAGIKASGRAAQVALQLNINVKIAVLPPDVDPADFIVRKGPEGWRKLLADSTHVIEFYLDKIVASNISHFKQGWKICQTVLPYVAALKSSIDKAHFVKIISERAAIKEESIWEDLKAIMKAPEYPSTRALRARYGAGQSTKTSFPSRSHSRLAKASPGEAGEEPQTRKDSIERKILGILYWQRTLSKPEIDLESIQHRLVMIIGEDNFKIKTQEIEGENKEKLIFEAEVFYQGSNTLVRDVDEILLSLEEEFLSNDLMQTMKKLHQVEKIDDHNSASKVLQRCHNLSKRINEIKMRRYDEEIYNQKKIKS